MHLLLPVGPCVPTGRYWLAGVAAAIAVVQIQEAPPIKWRVLPRAAKYWYQTLVPEATCECCDGKEGPFVPPRYYESCAKRCAPSPAPSPPPAPLSIGTVHLALGAQTLFAQGHTGTLAPADTYLYMPRLATSTRCRRTRSLHHALLLGPFGSMESPARMLPRALRERLIHRDAQTRSRLLRLDAPFLSTCRVFGENEFTPGSLSR